MLMNFAHNAGLSVGQAGSHYFGGPVVCECTWLVEAVMRLSGTQVFLIGWLTHRSTEGLADLLTDRLRGELAEGLTDSLIYRLEDWLTDWLAAWSTDYVPGSKAFPHVLLHAAFQSGNAALSLHSVYSMEPSRGSATPLHLHIRPQTPLLRPPLISNRDFLSPSLASPFSRSSTPTDMLDEAILKELTDVGWFAPGFLTLPEWCIWCGVYSALINV